MTASLRVAVLAGGYGGAKLSHGLALIEQRDPPLDLSVVVNTADDLQVHGLCVSPDLDTVMYTLAGLANPDTGWGLRDETWSAAEMLERYGVETWFRLGDRDLATNLLRTDRLRRGDRLTAVTDGLARALGIRARLLPMTDDRVATKVRTDDGWLDFQEYFVHRRHEDTVHELRYEGIAAARPTEEVLDALESADLLLLAPSNPFLSIGPILALPGVVETIVSARARVVAISPIVAGKAVRGPADRIFTSLGGRASAAGVATHYVERYPDLLDALVIDEVDYGDAPAIEALGLRVFPAATVMRSEPDRERLATEILESLGRRG